MSNTQSNHNSSTSISPLPSSIGLIEKVLFIDTATVKQNGTYSVTRGEEGLLDIIDKMTSNRTNRIEFWIMLGCNYDDPFYLKGKSASKLRAEVNRINLDFVQSIKNAEYWKRKANINFDQKTQILAIPPNLDFGVLAKEVIDSHLLVVENGCGTIAVRDKHEVSRWVQDYFYVMRTGNNIPVLLDPYYSSRSFMEKYVAEQVAEMKDVLLKPTNLRFQGGNILVGEKFIIIGTDTIRENLDSPKSWRHYSGIEGDIHATFGNKQVIIPLLSREELNSGNVPKQHDLLFHIDLYITLGGKADGKERIFIAQLYTTKFEQDDLIPDEGVEATYLDQLACWFESYQCDDINLSFSVTRLPAIFIPGEGVPSMFSHNNCLVESSATETKVYFPHFESSHSPEKEALEWAEEELLRRVPPKVTSIMLEKSFYKEAKDYKGSLHCMTKVIQRTIE